MGLRRFDRAERRVFPLHANGSGVKEPKPINDTFIGDIDAEYEALCTSALVAV